MRALNEVSLGHLSRSRSATPVRSSPLFWLLISVCIFAFGLLLYQRLPYASLAAIMGALFGVTIFTIVSFRWVQIPVVLWLLSLMGFRELVFIPTPGLPDITLDRLMMLWSCAVFTIKVIVERRRLPGPYLLDLLLATHGLYLLGNLLFTNPPALNLWSRSTLMAYSSYFLAKYLFTDVKWLRVVFAILFLTNIYNGVTSIAEKMHWDFLVWPKFILDRSIGLGVPGRSRGIFLQSGVLGTCMAMVLCVNVYFIRIARSVPLKIFTAAAFAISVLGLYFTYTRGSWLAGAVGLAGMTVLGARAYARQTIVMAIVTICVMGLGLLNVGQDRFMQKRLKNQETVEGRISTLSNAFRMARDHPLFGVGYFNYMKNIPNYRGTERVPFFGVIRRGAADEVSVHDIYVGAIAETGLVGFGLQMAIYAVLARALLKKRRRRPGDEHFEGFVIPVLVSMLIAYLWGGIAFDYRYFETLNSLGFFTAGILYGYVGQRQIPRYSRAEEPASGPRLVAET